MYAHILIYAGEAYSDIGDFDKGERLLIKAKTISESIGATTLDANSTELLGIIALGKVTIKRPYLILLAPQKNGKKQVTRLNWQKCIHILLPFFLI